ncbi:hypothetical protein AB0C11_40435 [Streptomyces sp. NPDC039016]|uniref:hypothetical protein n=1 Tax=Streptomyces sp. NPDC039016 TaxID=3154330 RepID=UPI0033E41005
MTSDERPDVQAGMDPLGDIVLTVRGDGNGGAPDYELPPAVKLDQASEVLGIAPADGLALAKIDGYPVPVIDLGSEGYRVGTAHLIRHAGLDKVRDVLRVRG